MREPEPDPDSSGNDPNTDSIHTANHANTDTAADYTDAYSSDRNTDPDASDDSEPDPGCESSGAGG